MGQRAELPAEVWQWIDHVLPGAEQHITRPEGGYAPGVRGRVDGSSSSAFVKALPISHPSIDDERIEVALLARLQKTGVAAERAVTPFAPRRLIVTMPIGRRHLLNGGTDA